MTTNSEIQYRLHFTCDGCGSEAFHESAWEVPSHSSVTYLPLGWVHFFGISAIQIDDVRRTARGMDFCDICLEKCSLRMILEKVPFDKDSLKAAIPPVNGYGTLAPHNTG